MINIDIAVFRKNVKKYLAVPCQVTRYGVPIASIIPVNTTYTSQKEIIKEAKKLGKIFTATVGDMQNTVAMGTAGPTATGFDGGEGINPNWKTIWFNGVKHWVDEFGNDKGEVK